MCIHCKNRDPISPYRNEAERSQKADEMTLFTHSRKDTRYGANDKHFELISWLRPITMMYLWPPFTPSIQTMTLIQHNRPSVCLECRPPSFSAFALLSVLSPSFSLNLSLQYLSIYPCISPSQPRSNPPPPPSPHLKPPPLLSPPLCSKWIPPGSTAGDYYTQTDSLSSNFSLSSSSRLSLSFIIPFFLYLSLPSPPMCCIFLFFASTRIRVSLHEPVYGCTGHLALFPSACFTSYPPYSFPLSSFRQSV